MAIFTPLPSSVECVKMKEQVKSDGTHININTEISLVEDDVMCQV